MPTKDPIAFAYEVILKRNLKDYEQKLAYFESYLEERLIAFQSECQNKIDATTFYLEGEFLKRMAALEYNVEKQCEKRKRLFPKWWK